MPHHRLVLLLIIAATVTYADITSQGDWSGGDNFPGPEVTWGRKFDNSEHINWAGIPGELLLSLESITPVETIITTGFAGADFCSPADFDGDGDMDILVTGSTSNTIAWWENTDGTGTAWAVHTIDETFDGASSCYATDIDFDGDVDAVGTSPDLNTLAWWENTDAMGTSWTQHIINDSLPLLNVDFCFAADFGYDTDMDILASSSSGGWLYWWENKDSTGTNNWHPHPIDNNVDGISCSYAADINGDSNIDVIGTLENDNKVTWWRDLYGHGTQWEEHLILGLFDGASFCFPGDIDGDTDIDILATAESGNRILWLENLNGSGSSWDMHTIDDAFTGANNCYLADMDSDGDLDVLGASSTGVVIWWENDDRVGTAWTEHMITDAFNGACCTKAADFDSDDIVDIVAVSETAGRVSWWDILQYSPEGILESSILSFSLIPDAHIDWGAVTWNDTLPPETELVIQVRASADSSIMGDWSEEIAISGTGLSAYLDRNATYLQYRTRLRSTNPQRTPHLDEITIEWTENGGDVMTVTTPDSTTVWEHFQTGYAVNWLCADSLGSFLSLPGDTVSITLYSNGLFVDTLIISTPNDSTWIMTELVKREWAPDTTYTVRVEDELGNYGVSDYFEIVNVSGQEVITITDPTAATIWEHYETDTEVLWEYPALLSGDSIAIEIYHQGGIFIDTYAEWTPNDGEYIRSEGIDPSWGRGDDYKLKIFDKYGNYGWSDEFSLEVTEVLEIFEPSGMSEWKQYQTDLPLEWEPSDGDTVDFDLYLQDEFMETLATGVLNTGEWEYPGPVSGDWEPSDEYSIKVTDNYGDWGWSEYFRIVYSEGEEIIVITDPDTSTIWVQLETNLPIVWEYPSRSGTLSGDSVSITLYEGSDPVDTLSASTANDGYWLFEETVSTEWAAGTKYSIYIEDNFSNYGWSANFTVEEPSGQEIITVSAPSAATNWLHYETDTEVLWEYPAILYGDSIAIDIYSGGSYLGSFADWTVNDGEYIRTEGIIPAWGDGHNFSLKVYDSNSNFGWSENFTISSAEIINVTKPNESSEWMHYSTDNAIAWDTAGIQSSTVDIAIYQNGAPLETLVTSTENDGSWNYEEIIPETWNIASDYQIYIIDNYGDWGWSGNFSVVESSGQDVITITDPNVTTIWTHFETDKPIRWEYPMRSDSKSGDRVDVSLYDGENLVETLFTDIDNDGACTYAGPVPMEWAPGNNYRIYIEDNLANYGWSITFNIEATSGAEIITVTHPDTTTVWNHYTEDVMVLWEYPTILSGDSVQIELWKDNQSSFIADFSGGWVANTGSFIYEEVIPPTWEPDDDYQIKVIDNLDNYGWCGKFTIEPDEIIDITKPDSSTTWMHYSTSNDIEWDITGLQSTTVDILLYKNGVLLQTFIEDTENDGSWTYESMIPDTWELGSDYQIYIIDNYGDWGWSENFSVVESSGQDVITITDPSSGTIWTHFETDLPVDWEYPAVLEALQGDSVSITLYDGDDIVEVLTASTYNDGTWLYEETVPMSWQPGTEYRISIEDNLGNYGWSEYFEVASVAAEIIIVTEPTGETVWQHLETNTVVQWEYPVLMLASGPLSGDSVYMEIWQDGSMLDDFCGWVANTGTYTRADSIPESWGIGSDFQIKVIDDLDNWGFSAEFTIEDLGIEGGEVESYQLLPIVPNPAGGTFAITFRVPEISHVTINVFDLSGRLITSVFDEEAGVGSYTSQASGLPTGVYICRMEAGIFRASERVVVIR